MFRGTIVSVEPQREVVILVEGTAELRHVPWAEVARVQRGRDAVTPPPVLTAVMPTLVASAPVTPELPPPMPPLLGAPRLHIDASAPVTLHQVMDTPEGRIRPIACQSPCDRVIDGRSGEWFFFSGDEIPESKRFRLIEKSGDTAVQVSRGNHALGTAGTLFTVFGSLGLTAGLPTLIVGEVARHDGHPTSPVPLIGGGLLGVSAAVLVTGIVMSVTGATRYDFQTAAAASPGVVRF
jgi:hypothetical protein